MWWPDGRTYKGSFEDGQKHGPQLGVCRVGEGELPFFAPVTLVLVPSRSLRKQGSEGARGTPKAGKALYRKVTLPGGVSVPLVSNEEG